jgi:hypothetical protein
MAFFVEIESFLFDYFYFICCRNEVKFTLQQGAVEIAW